MEKMRKKKGFTLIEIMVVISIIGIILGIAIPSVSMYRRRAKEAKARADIENLGIAIKMYQVDNGSYPNASGLVSTLESGGYMEFKDEEVVSGNFVDPWRNPYQYDSDGGHNSSFDIYSYGHNKIDESGGGDDITNW